MMDNLVQLQKRSFEVKIVNLYEQCLNTMTLFIIVAKISAKYQNLLFCLFVNLLLTIDGSLLEVF